MEQRSAKGFTLIEILVALLVLAVGIAGAAAAQIVAARTRHQSALHSQAVQLAASLAERMRAHGAGLYSGFTYDAAAGAPPAGASCYGQSQCDSARMVAFDLAEVSALLHSRFPAGRMAVCRDATVWDSARKRLTWQCAASAQAPVVVKVGYREKAGDGKEAADGEVLPVVALAVAGSVP